MEKPETNSTLLNESIHTYLKSSLLPRSKESSSIDRKSFHSRRSRTDGRSSERMRREKGENGLAELTGRAAQPAIPPSIS